jgi:hypothetical protein
VTATEQARTAMRDSDHSVRFHDTAGTSTVAPAGLVVDGLALTNR